MRRTLGLLLLGFGIAVLRPVAAEEPLSTAGAPLVSVQASANADLLSAARDLGADGVRVTPNIGWFGIERTVGKGYDWSTPDATQMLVESYGFENFRNVLPTRPDDPGKPSCATGSSTVFLVSSSLRPAFQAFVKAVVERYDGDGVDDMPGLTRPVKRWSFTPEVPTNWCPTGDVNGVLTMFQLFADAVHAADPTAEVLFPLNTQGVYLAAFADGALPVATIQFKGQTLTRSQVAAQYAQNISFTKALLAGAKPDAYDIHLYGDASAIPYRKSWLLSYVASQGLPARPVYAMEGGEPFVDFGERFPQGPTTCPTGSVTEDAGRLAYQSETLIRHYVLAFASGYGIVTSNLFSEYTDFGAPFGDLDLQDACHHPRPAYFAYRLMRQELLPYASVAEVGGLPSGVRMFSFTFPPPRLAVFVAWDDTAAPGATLLHDLSAVLPFSPAAFVATPPTASGQTAASVVSAPVTAIPFGVVPVFIDGVSSGPSPRRYVSGLVLDTPPRKR